MAVLRPHIGIEFHLDEIRAVEARTGIGGGLTITAVGSVPMPAYATEQGRIRDKQALIDALKVLLPQMGATAKTAYVGVAAQACAVRLMDLPAMPEQELRTVIQGEIQHLQLLTEPGVAFDYVEVEHAADPESDTHRYLVMGVEESLLEGYKDLLRAVNLEAEVFEPVTMSLYRAAYPLFEEKSVALFVSITELRSEVAIVTSGKISFYRRLNIGTDELCPPPDAETPEGEVPIQILAPAEQEVSADAARSLAMELRRSVDYYSRQFSEGREIEIVVMACSHQRGEAIKTMFERYLGASVTLAMPPMSPAPNIAAELMSPSGVRYSAAFGLATHPLSGKPGMPPRFDLIDPIRILQARQKIRVGIAIGFASFILLLFFAIMVFFMRQANNLGTQLVSVEADTIKLEGELQKRGDEASKRMAQLRLLSQETVPLPAIIDQINMSLSPDASLSGVRVDTNGHVQIEGIAKSAEAVTETANALRRRLHPSAEIATLDNSTDPRFPSAKHFVITVEYPLVKPGAT